jgi:hypothetical protein
MFGGSDLKLVIKYLIVRSAVEYGAFGICSLNANKPIFGGNPNDDWSDPPNVNTELEKNRDQIRQRRLFCRLAATDTLSKGVGDWLQQIAEDAAKELGAAAVKALISLAES